MVCCEFCNQTFKYDSYLKNHIKRNKECFYQNKLKIKDMEMKNLNDKILQQKKEISLLKEQNINLSNHAPIYVLNNNINNNINNVFNTFNVKSDDFVNHLTILDLDKNNEEFKKKFQNLTSNDVIGEMNKKVDFLNTNILQKNDVINYVCKDKENKLFTFVDSKHNLQFDKNAEKLIDNISTPMEQQIRNIIKNEFDVLKKEQLRNSLTSFTSIKNKKSKENELFVNILAEKNSIENFKIQNNKRKRLENKLLCQDKEIFYEF